MTVPSSTARTSTVAHPARSAKTPLYSVQRPAFRPPRMPFVLLVVGLLAGGLVGLLLLNTALAQGSFRIHDLQSKSSALSIREQQLQLAVDTAGTPRSLAKAAKKLGLVPAHDPGFLRLSDGRVLGDPRPATSPLPPPPPTPAASGGTATGQAATTGTKPHGSTASPAPTPQASATAKPATGGHHAQGGRG